MAQSVLGIYKCIYNFKAEASNDLELLKGDVICVTRRISNEWLYGTARGHCGQFPVNFAELVFNKPTLRVGLVLNEFISEHQDDLQLFEGDIIGIERDIDANWRYGFSKVGSGMFPTNFVKEINFTTDVTGKRDSNNNNHTNSNKNKNLCHGKAVVIDSFQAQDQDELSIQAGEFVELTKEIDSFWIEGILNGKKGKFPRMYINIIEDLPVDLKFRENKIEKKPEPQAKALYMFIGTNPEEISFDKGDIIMLVDRLSKDWLVGKVGKTIGRFPSNYVEVLVDLPYSDKPKWSPTKPPPMSTNAKPSQGTNSKPLASQIKPKPKLQPKPTNSPGKPVTPAKPIDSVVAFKTGPQPVVTKVVASNIPAAQKKRASSQPGRSGSFRENNHSSQTVTNDGIPKSTPSPNTTTTVPSNSRKDAVDSSKPIESNPAIMRNGSVKRTDMKCSNSITKNTPSNTNFSGGGIQRRSSLSGKKRAPAIPHQFELVEEKIFDMYSKPATSISAASKPSTLERKKNNSSQASHQKPPVDQLANETSSSKQNKTMPRLPKPLAPMPAGRPSTGGTNRARPKSLSFQPSSRLTTPSPVSSINSKSFTVSYSKNQQLNENEENEVTAIFPRSETDPSISTREQLERPSLTPDPIIKKPNGLTRERPKSLYFASSNGSAPSPEKRSQTLDAVLQRVCMLCNLLCPIIYCNIKITVILICTTAFYFSENKYKWIFLQTLCVAVNFVLFSWSIFQNLISSLLLFYCDEVENIYFVEI